MLQNLLRLSQIITGNNHANTKIKNGIEITFYTISLYNYIDYSYLL